MHGGGMQNNLSQQNSVSPCFYCHISDHFSQYIWDLLVNLSYDCLYTSIKRALARWLQCSCLYSGDSSSLHLSFSCHHFSHHVNGSAIFMQILSFLWCQNSRQNLLLHIQPTSATNHEGDINELQQSFWEMVKTPTPLLHVTMSLLTLISIPPRKKQYHICF